MGTARHASARAHRGRRSERINELRALIARHARPDLSTPIEDALVFRADEPYPPTPTTYGRVMALIAQGTSNSRWAIVSTSNRRPH